MHKLKEFFLFLVFLLINLSSIYFNINESQIITMLNMFLIPIFVNVQKFRNFLFKIDGHCKNWCNTPFFKNDCFALFR